MPNNLPKTEKGQQTKDLILQKAFHLFLFNGYEKGTIAELIENSGMSRGAIFYYYQDKFTLYKAVIDRYIIKTQAFASQIEYREEMTLPELIEEYVKAVESMLGRFLDIPEYTPVLYFNMIFQATIYYPQFKNHLAAIFDREDDLWEKVIRKDMERGSIRENLRVNDTVRHFRNAYLGLSFESCYKEMMTPDELRALYTEIYRSIKK